MVPSAALGQFVGGYISKHYKLRIRGLNKQCIISMLVSLLLIPCFWIDCGQVEYVGINSQYIDR